MKGMAKKFTITLDTQRYREPTQEELDAAKRFIVRRSRAANAVREVAHEAITDAAVEIARIALRYNIDPKRFAFDSSVSEAMMDEVAAVMDALEDELMELLQDKATEYARDDGTKTLLLGFLFALGHRNLGLRNTIHEYLWRTLRQTEALVVAAKENKLSQSEAMAMVRNSLATAQASAMVRSLMRYRQLYNAQFIRDGGRATFSDGSPNVQGVPVSGLEATLNVMESAVNHTWQRAHSLEMQRQGAIGYWQFRGSDFPCAICDEEAGFHPVENPEDWMYEDFPHEHCRCGRLPIFNKQELNNLDI